MHKLQYVDFDARVTTFRDLNVDEDVAVGFDFCIGADGSFSTVRRQMMRVVRFVIHEFIGEFNERAL